MRSRDGGRCPVCGERAWGRRMATAAAEGPSYRICDACGSARAVDEIDFEEHYEEYFPRDVREDSPLLARRYAALLEELERRAPGRRLLEVGCGNGQLLAVAGERGWEVAGTELSRAQAEHCAARGLDVLYGDVAREDLFAGRRFDAAVLIEVVEHLPDPAGMLRAVGRLLVPGGVLHLTTPNFGALSRRVLDGEWSILNPEHVVLATPGGMRELLGRTGYRPEGIRSRNVNVGEILRHLRSDGDAGVTPGERFRAAVEVRDRIEASAGLRLLKRLVNGVLGVTGLGDTLVVFGRREGR